MKSSVVLMVLMAGVLVACGEKPQELGGAGRQDTAAYKGTGVTAFTAGDWKPGDKVSWEQKLKARGQYGQNDYTRVH
jgi:hypothetical protein